MEKEKTLAEEINLLESAAMVGYPVKVSPQTILALIKSNRALEKMAFQWQSAAMDLQTKLDKAREALEYYATKYNYECIDHGDLHEKADKTKRNFNHIPVYALDLKGGIARATLAEINALDEKKESE